MLRAVLLIVGVLGLLTLIVVAVGYALPVGHVAARQRLIAQPAAPLFDTISEPAHYPEWRSDVRQVEILSTAPLRWRESGSNGDIVFVVIERRAAARLVTRIDDAALPFGGTWTFELEPRADQTLVTITEQGEVYNPVYRFMSRFVFGHTATLDAYLTSLAGRAAAEAAHH